ncbi:hypothetical protein cyc_04123 [Cyclospora cayetanensis]|uniref:Uncharacterized protein n=1 Tax=Cyclospora cayetanensis TaxID=88456 RepID=A0A1D3D6B0_9EIME|nr:hypothetical protein cyc_04123 [Cyclospora cayetanensis]
MESFAPECDSQGLDSIPPSVAGDQTLQEAPGAPSCLESTAESEGAPPPMGPHVEAQDGSSTGAPEDVSKPWGLGVEEAPPRFIEQPYADGVNIDKLHQFRAQLHQLSRQKDGLMPNPGKPNLGSTA